MKKQPPDTTSGPALVVRDGRDELNLAEWPISVSGGRRGHRHGNSVTLSDTIRTPEGQLTTRQWTIMGTEEFGLPTPFCEDVYVGLMHLSHEQGFLGRTLQTSLREICRCLQLTPGGQNLQRIKEALQCLTLTGIRAEKAFWSKAEQQYKDGVFHILDDVVFPRDTQPTSQVTLTWNQIFWSNIMAGHLKTLSMEFYNSLSGPIAKKLYRYLDKHRWDNKRQYRIGLSKLAMHLGLAEGYPSQWKQRLQGAHDQLLAQGFLASVEYVAGREEELVAYTFSDPTEQQAQARQATLPLGEDYEPVVPLLEDQIQQVMDQLSSEELEALQEEAWQQLSPALRELTGGRKTHFAVHMEVRRIIRERYIEEKDSKEK
jgi:hypothetical protein